MGHDHTHNANKKALWFSFIIITGYMIVEAVGGFLTNSLALLSDAGHMLSDSISLGVGLLAFIIGERAADQYKTFGYKRFEVLAALFNGVTLIVIALFIFFEAYKRFSQPPEVASTGMLIIATIGFIVNIVVAKILMKQGTDENLNLRAAFLHVLGDLIGSVGAIIAAILIIIFNWGWADPLASVIVAILVFISGIRVTKEAVHILMEGTPKDINIDAIIEIIESSPNIIRIHHLHIWTITSGKNALSCHAVVSKDMTIGQTQRILNDVEAKLREKNIEHITIQIETEAHLHGDSIIKGEDHSHTNS